MNIPESPRVLYQLNPLAEVSCQLRFPTILKIGSQEPAEFQERIRSNYPIYEIVQNLDLSPELQNILKRFSNPLTTDFIYQFTSEDLTWRVFLHKDFIALATRQYSRYEEFKEKLQDLLDVFEDIYTPNFYSQVSLKYLDLIIRSDLQLETVDWTELIQPYIANELQLKEISSSIASFMNFLNLTMEDRGELIFKHGLVNVENEEKNIQEQAYLIETEFFTPPINIQKGNHVWNCLDKYNALSGRIFRWSITEKLHNAMAPKPINNTAS